MEPSRDKLATLVTAPNEGAAGVIRAMLDAEGIPSWQHTESVYLGIWGAAGFHPTSVRVRESDLLRARDAMDSARRDSVDLNWDEIDVGEPQDDIAARIASRPEHLGPRRHGFHPGPILIWTIVLIFGLLYGGPPGVVIVLACAGAAIWWSIRARSFT